MLKGSGLFFTAMEGKLHTPCQKKEKAIWEFISSFMSQIFS
jgi:hypothetical protein